MRTTLTIDDDLAAIIERERRRKGLSLREMINTTLRRGLAGEALLESRPTFQVRPMDLGLRPGIDPTKLNQLGDDLEVDGFLRKQAK